MAWFPSDMSCKSIHSPHKAGWRGSGCHAFTLTNEPKFDVKTVKKNYKTVRTSKLSNNQDHQHQQCCQRKRLQRHQKTGTVACGRGSGLGLAREHGVSWWILIHQIHSEHCGAQAQQASISPPLQPDRYHGYIDLLTSFDSILHCITNFFISQLVLEFLAMWVGSSSLGKCMEHILHRLPIPEGPTSSHVFEVIYIISYTSYYLHLFVSICVLPNKVAEPLTSVLWQR
jgi:hypothetical protein